MGLFQRTIEKFLTLAEKDVKIAAYVDGKLLTGVASKHRTRSGVMYNNLMRLHRRTHPPKPLPEWDEADEMCPNCVTPWKCNGPHIPQTGE